MNATEIINALRAKPNNAYVVREAGKKRLTLSWSPARCVYRYFQGSRSGGGGRKYNTCDEVQAHELIARFPGGTIDSHCAKISDLAEQRNVLRKALQQAQQDIHNSLCASDVLSDPHCKACRDCLTALAQTELLSNPE